MPDQDGVTRGIVSKLTSSNAMLMFGSTAAMLIAVGFVLHTSSGNPGPTDSALLFMGFILLALAGFVMAAAAFKGIGYVSAGPDAFGLPSGSIRALLGLALMIMLIVFGLPFLRIESEPRIVSDKSFAAATVSCGELKEALSIYRSSGLIAVSDAKACAAAPAAGAPAPQATIQLFRVTAEWPSSTLDLNKQTITAIVTLLTTVVGFYFGSASTAAGQSKLIDKITAGSSGSGGVGSQ